MTSLFNVLLFSLSLCADCFAVSLCSAVTLRKTDFRKVATVSAVFAVIQSGLLLFGWVAGSIVASHILGFAHVAGFLLMFYVGASMVVEGIKGNEEHRDLNGFRNVLLAGVATSIDALSAGASLSLAALPLCDMLWRAAAVAVFTSLSVVAGILGGKSLGKYAGRISEIVGGTVLIAIGVGILI